MTYVGRPLTRREDERFLAGRARYLDDLHPERALHAAAKAAKKYRNALRELAR